jgi:hypothetical protein
MAAALHAIAKESASYIKGLMDECKKICDKPDAGGRRSQIKAVADTIEEHCLNVGLASFEKVLPKHIAVHPENRHKVMAEAVDAHELAKFIFVEGWSDKMVEAPRAFERLTGAAGDMQVDKNLKLIDNSNGLLPAQLGSDMRIMTVACTHTGFVVKIISADPPCVGIDQELCGPDMKINKNKILEACPSLRRPCVEGITYVVFKACLEELCPDLPAFLAEAGNAGHGVHRQQTTIQSMLQINNRLQAYRSRGEEPDVEAIAKAIEAIDPMAKGETLDLANYVAKYGGGSSGIFIHQLEDFSKGLKARRTIPSSQFKLLSQARMTQAPKFINAMLMASLSCPDHPSYVVRGETKLWSSADIQALNKCPADVTKVVSWMDDARSWLESSSGLPSSRITALVGQFSVDLVMLLHKKTVKSAIPRPKTYDEAKDRLLAMVEAEGACLTTAPWEVSADYHKKEVRGQNSPSKKRKSAAVVEYDNTSGALSKAALQQFGFETGAMVKHIKNGTVHTIEGIDDDKHEVKLVANGTEATGATATSASSTDVDENAVVVPTGEILDAYEIYKPRPPVWITANDIPQPPVIKDAKLEFSKAAIRMSMSYVWDDMGEQPVDVLVTGKGKHPVFRVFASSAVNKNKMKLMAFSPQVGATTDNIPTNAHAVDVEVERGDDTYKLYVSPPKMVLPKAVAAKLDLTDEGGPLIVPFWIVRHTQDSAKVNAERTSLAYDVKVPGMSTTMFKFSVPVVTNTRALKIGEELLLYKAEADTPPPPMIQAKKAAKKAQPKKGAA